MDVPIKTYTINLFKETSARYQRTEKACEIHFFCSLLAKNIVGLRLRQQNCGNCYIIHILYHSHTYMDNKICLKMFSKGNQSEKRQFCVSNVIVDKYSYFLECIFFLLISKYVKLIPTVISQFYCQKPYYVLLLTGKN